MSAAKVFLVFAALSACAFSGRSYEITGAGRRIQLDGFLMDWAQKERKSWPGSDCWSWDAANTPEGLAGYFHADSVRCPSWTFYCGASRFKAAPWSMAPDTAAAGGRFYRYAAPRSGRSFEWVVPWDSMVLDSSGRYAVHLAGMSACRDTLTPVLLTGTVYSLVKRSWLPPRFAERVLAIVALFVVFIALQLRMRKKSRRREWPRRPA